MTGTQKRPGLKEWMAHAEINCGEIGYIDVEYSSLSTYMTWLNEWARLNNKIE